jgi:hypothetical protein
MNMNASIPFVVDWVMKTSRSRQNHYISRNVLILRLFKPAVGKAISIRISDGACCLPLNFPQPPNRGLKPICKLRFYKAFKIVLGRGKAQALNFHRNQAHYKTQLKPTG